MKSVAWKDPLVGGYNKIKMYTVEEESLRMKVNKKKKVRKHKQKLEDKLDESSPNYFYLYLTDREKENIEKAKTDSAEVLTVMKGHCKWRKHRTRKMMIQPCEEKKENDDEVKVE